MRSTISLFHRATAAPILVAAFVMAACGCGSTVRDTPPPPATNPVSSAAADPSSAPARPVADSRPRVVFLGDSLTAGLGLPPEESYPALLQQRIDRDGLKYEVVNAGVSGDTSAGGLSRLDWALDGDVKVLVIALGGNDALRGLPVEELGRNLTAIIDKAQARQIKVLLTGMEAPPNFGRSYTVSFHKIYPELAAKYKVPLVPFLLEGVAGIESLNQRDGIHPTAEGAGILAETVWRTLRPMLE